MLEPAGSTNSIWLDVTSTFGWKRAAVGIVRVEAETIRYLLSIGGDNVRFCQFDRKSGCYAEVSRGFVISALARLDAGGGNARKFPLLSRPMQLFRRLRRYLLRRKHEPQSTRPFKARDVYISLGLDWEQKDLRLVHAIKKKLGLKVILFCYDIIPILMPEYCWPGTVEKLPKYFVDMARCADTVLCISECSRDDLRKYLESVDAPVPALELIRLGGDIHVDPMLPPSPEVAEIIDKRYILFVSSIEPRKNHKILCNAYKKLLESGKKDLPLLVFVGMLGGCVDDFIDALHADRELGPYIRLLNRVSDSDLAHLYRNCLFTVYPSLYEGWGLPVAESLAYGKFCIASNAASIPEVGGDLIEYISPEEEERWAERLSWYFQHPEELIELEKKIKQNYRPTAWRETAAVIFQTAQRMNDYKDKELSRPCRIY